MSLAMLLVIWQKHYLGNSCPLPISNDLTFLKQGAKIYFETKAFPN
jgi:hypothetical protein